MRVWNRTGRCHVKLGGQKGWVRVWSRTGWCHVELGEQGEGGISRGTCVLRLMELSSQTTKLTFLWTRLSTRPPSFLTCHAAAVTMPKRGHERQRSALRFAFLLSQERITRGTAGKKQMPIGIVRRYQRPDASAGDDVIMAEMEEDEEEATFWPMRCLSKFPDTERTTPWRDMVDPDVRAGTSSGAEAAPLAAESTSEIHVPHPK